MPDRELAAAEDLAKVSLSQQAMKSERTRTELLRAAEVVFARDGFEASRIEDIAAEAGRSRGAFYANFASKTEVFLALRSLATRRNARALRERIQDLKDEEERYSAIIGYIVEQICDTQTQLLQIEFKLFALRHPEMLEELAEKPLGDTLQYAGSRGTPGGICAECAIQSKGTGSIAHSADCPGVAGQDLSSRLKCDHRRQMSSSRS
jgi:AcrR family transcriptional regulator